MDDSPIVIVNHGFNAHQDLLHRMREVIQCFQAYRHALLPYRLGKWFQATQSYPYRLGGEDEQDKDVTAEVSVQSAERWSILEDRRSFSDLAGTEKPRNSGGEFHQFALFIQLIKCPAQGSSIELAVCPRGCDVGGFGHIQGQKLSI